MGRRSTQQSQYPEAQDAPVIQNSGVQDNMMKKAIAAVVLAAMTMSAQAGVLINEGFDNVAGLAASGWTGLNSATAGLPNGWFQGVSDSLGADGQSGGINSFAAINFNVLGNNGSTQLITPEFDASGGVDISFYLRAAGEGFADLLSYGFAGVSATTVTVNPVPDSAWTLYNVHLDANTLGTTRFAFQYGGTFDTANFVGLDSLTISTPDAAGDVPEPASLALLAGGLLGLGAMRRRARR
jgi:hypothetical protein